MCVGAIVKTKNGRKGIVIAADYDKKFVVMQSGRSFWTEDMRNIEVVSYSAVYLPCKVEVR